MIKIEIEIPEVFEYEFKSDRFESTFRRMKSDAHFWAGNYEIETIEMLIVAFKNAEILKEEK